MQRTQYESLLWRLPRDECAPHLPLLNRVYEHVDEVPVWILEKFLESLELEAQWKPVAREHTWTFSLSRFLSGLLVFSPSAHRVFQGKVRSRIETTPEVHRIWDSFARWCVLFFYDSLPLSEAELAKLLDPYEDRSPLRQRGMELAGTQVNSNRGAECLIALATRRPKLCHQAMFDSPSLEAARLALEALFRLHSLGAPPPSWRLDEVEAIRSRVSAWTRTKDTRSNLPWATLKELGLVGSQEPEAGSLCLEGGPLPPLELPAEFLARPGVEEG